MSDKRVVKGEETYNRLMKAAVDIVSEEGVSGITASKLSSNAGVSKSNIFHHFKSTSDIPIALFKVIIEEMTIEVEVNKYKQVKDFLDMLEVLFFQESLETKVLKRVFFSFYNEALFGDIYKLMLSEFLLESEKAFTNILMGCQDNKRNIEETKTYSRLIIACLDGIGLHLLFEEKQEVYTTGWQLQKELLIQGLTKA